MDVTAAPGPREPAIVQAARWALGPDRFLAGNVERFGSPFRMKLPFGYGDHGAVFATRSAAKAILRLPPDVAHGGEAYGILSQSSGPTSVIVKDEAEHLRLRKLLLPPFHGERLQQWGDYITELTHDEIARWPVGEPFALRPITERITMRVITRIVFGVRDADRAAELGKLLPVLFDIPPLVGIGFFTPLGRLDLGPASPWGRFRRKRDRIDALIRREIAERRSEFDRLEAPTTRRDVLSMLLTARDEDGRAMSDQELRDQLVTMLVAGHETTSTSIAWALERLLRTPAALERLLASLDRGETDYLDATIKETLRARPVVPQIGRLTTRDTTIDGWDVPARTMIMLPISVLHADPSIHPDPGAFRPERFLDGNDCPEYGWLPFGGGVKRCPGASLALLETRCVLAAILRSVRLAPDRIEPERPRVRGITLVPSRGGRVTVLERRDAARAPGPEPVAA